MDRKKLSKELKAMAKELEPSEAFLRRGRWATNEIYQALCAPSFEYSVDRMIVAGSIGKNTALDDSTDFDLVVFLNNVEPKFPRSLLENMERSIRHLLGYRKVKITKFSVQFQMQIEGHLFDFDLLPASNLLSKLCLNGIEGCNASNKQASAVRRRLTKYYEKYSDVGYSFSSSLSEQTILFLKKRPKDILDVIKIAKHWNKQLPIKSYVSGRSFIIELVAVHSQKRQIGCSLLYRFIKFLRCMEDFSTIEIVFGHNYQKKSIPENILEQKPLIMDPCNPYNNLAYKIDKKVVEMFEIYATNTLEILSESVKDANEVFEF